MTTDETPATAPQPTTTQDRPTFDTSVAHIARVYDYWLGGKDNYAADRKAGDAALAMDATARRRGWLVAGAGVLLGCALLMFPPSERKNPCATSRRC